MIASVFDVTVVLGDETTFRAPTSPDERPTIELGACGDVRLKIPAGVTDVRALMCAEALQAAADQLVAYCRDRVGEGGGVTPELAASSAFDWKHAEQVAAEGAALSAEIAEQYGPK